MPRYHERDFVVGFPFATYVKKIGKTYALVADTLELSTKIVQNYAQRGRMPLAVYRRLITRYGGAGLPAPRVEKSTRGVILPDSYNEDVPALPAPPINPHPELNIPLKQLVEVVERPAPSTPSQRTVGAETALAREIARHAVEILIEQLTAVTHERDLLVMERDRLTARNRDLESQVEIANQLMSEQTDRAQRIQPLPAPSPARDAAVEIIKDVAPASAAKVVSELESRLPKGGRTG